MARFYLLNDGGHSYWWFGILRINLRFIPFSVWAEKVSKTQIFKFYDKIVKRIITAIFMLDMAQATLMKSKTSSKCQGMNSRAFSKKSRKSVKIEILENRSRTQSLHPKPIKTSIECFWGIFWLKWSIRSTNSCKSWACLFVLRTINLKPKMS